MLSCALSAQSANANLRTSALLLSLNGPATEQYRGNVLLNRLPAAPAAHVHNSAYKAGVALVVIGPVKMLAGLGLVGWSANQYRINRNRNTDANANNFDRGVTFGVALGTFHLVTGAALTAGGIVLLHKSRSGSTSYLTMPELTMPQNSSIGSSYSGLGMRTSIVF